MNGMGSVSNMRVEHVKYATQRIRDILLVVMNGVLEGGAIPGFLWSNKVLIAPKKAGGEATMSNVRPIKCIEIIRKALLLGLV